MTRLFVYAKVAVLCGLTYLTYSVLARQGFAMEDTASRAPPDALARALHEQGVAPEDAYDWATYFLLYAEQTGTDPYELAAIAGAESNWNEKAYNPSDPSYGLMAVMPAFWESTFTRQCGAKATPENLLNARVAICYGAHIRAHFNAVFPRDSLMSLRAYNNGGGWESTYDQLVLQRKADLK